MSNHLLDRILEIKEALPKKQRGLCNYLALNHEQIGVMTVAELAKNAGVGTTTVMRLVQTLGFDSYTTFKRALVNASLVKNTSSYHSLKQGFARGGAQEGGSALRRVAESGSETLENLWTAHNREHFDKAVELLLKAENIYTLGLRSSKAFALYFEYTVDRFYPRVRQLSRESEFLFDRLAVNITPADVLMVYSVWPCTKKTIQAAEICRRAGIPVVLITNTSLNPLYKTADAVIDTNSVNQPSGGTALFAVTEALASELGRRSAPASTQNIERIEAMLKENDLITWED